MPRISILRLSDIFISRGSLALAGVLLAFGLLAFDFGPYSLRAVRSAGPSGEAAAASARRPLSFEERVKYQRAVEEVYWRHTTWPKQSAAAKPDLGVVAPIESTRAKVEDTLRKSEALAQLWKRPVTAEQLQAEMTRMARESRRPEVLRELRQALNNDPLVIAEVLVRPVLVERLVRNSYAYDDRLHGALRLRAEAGLREHGRVEEMRRMGGSFSEVEAVKVAQKPRRVVGSEDNAGAVAPLAGAGRTLELTAEEWDAETARLAASFNADDEEESGADAPSAELPTGRLSGLQEDADSFYVTSVIRKTDSRLKVARVEWSKTGFDSWWAEARGAYAASAAPAGDFAYQLSEVNQPASAADDTWTPIKALPITTGSAVWTGTEMIVWGGQPLTGGRTNSGARYDPATDTWTPTSAINAPRERRAHSAVWTGTEMIVWGGCGPNTDFCGLNDGGRYNPNTDTWAPISNSNAGSRSSHTAVWTGSQMIVWGGCSHGYNNRCNTLNSGGVYDLASDTWRPTSTAGAPTARSGHRAVWTGSQMIVWGPSNTGGRYNPSTDTWTPTNTFNAPSARSGFTMVWTGTEAVVWGGYEGNFVTLNTGGRYNPSTDSWTPTSTANAPAPRSNHVAVWTGAEMIVHGGEPRDGVAETSNTGGRYNPSADTWTPTSTLNAPFKTNHVAVWTGAEMIVWSANWTLQEGRKTGGRYNPSTDSWAPMDNEDSAYPVELGVWSGTEMIVWGRNPGCISGCPSAGGRYDLATNSWRPMNLLNAPPPGVTGRINTAVWTGSEMIVWGANNGAYTTPGEGGRYNPFSDTWARTTNVNAPVNRSFHTAVWTGTEMIVWGGESNEGVKQNTGGRYNPSTDSWTPTTTAGAPEARYIHTAVWTGAEMIVWGGISAAGPHLNTGGRYDPSTNSWTPTSTAGAPSERRFHTVVWIGEEMVVWGGMTGDYNSTDGLLNTGGRYTPATDSWQPTSLVGAPSPRTNHSAVWTGSLMLIWGGRAYNGLYNPGVHNGGRYNPSADAWTPTSTLRAASARSHHIALWTGTGMIVWGGIAEEGTATHGAIYYAPGAPVGNVPPSVSILSPAEGQTFQSGDNVFINLATSDGDGTVSTVHFYANDTLVGTDSAAPFDFTWNEVRGGSYSLTAVATDDAGGVAASSPVRISVSASTDPPVCALTSPAGGATYTAPADVPIAADARANRDRTLTRVEFFEGVRAVGTFTSQPYGFTWSNLGAGTYNFSVRCTDSAGATVTSPTSVVTINPDPNSYVRVTGQVADSRGVAIQNLRVRLDSSQSATPRHATTNINGYYQFGNLPAGADYTVTPESTVYNFAPPSRSYPAMSQNDDNANFVATQIGYGISGRLTDQSGNPLYPATVNLSGSATASKGTDANGNYFFSNLTPGGNYTIQPYRNQFNFTPPYRTFNNLGADQTADFTGTPAPPPSLSAGDVAVTEGNAGTTNATFTVTLSAASSQTVTVNYATFDGTATAGSDHVAASGSLTYAPGETAKVVTVAVKGDAVDEADETFFVNLSGATNATVSDSQGAGTIADDDGERVNVALASNGGTATASSSYSAMYPASSVINGDRRGLNWNSGGGWNDATSGAYPDWVEVSFGGARRIDEIDVFTLQDSLASPSEPTEAMTFAKYGVTGMRVEYWTGTAWEVVPGGVIVSSDKVWNKLTFAPVTASRVRVIVNNGLLGYSRLVEVEAWGVGDAAPAPAGRTNVALATNGGVASASSTYSQSYPASSVNNGDRRGLGWNAGGGWNDATSGAYPDWIEVAFAGEKSVEEVSVFTLQDSPSAPLEPTEAMTFTKYGATAMRVEYWTGTAWATVPDGVRAATDRVWNKFTFAPVSTTKIRVVVTGALAGYSRIVEVEAWQPDAAQNSSNHALSANGGVATASSSYSFNYPAASVINGDRRGLNWNSGGGWNDATGGSFPDWIEVAFAGERSLTEVNVFTLQDDPAAPAEPTEALQFTKYGVTAMRVEYWTGISWAEVPGGGVAGNDRVWRKFTFPAVATRKIRVVVTGALAGHSRLAEIEAY